MSIDVHQCPRCELRFANSAELRDHFGRDHHADPDTFDRYRYPARSARVDTDRQRILLVANQTLGDERLVDEVRARAQAGPVRLTVLVPATHSAHHASPPSGTVPPPESAAAGDDVGLATARWRLRTTLDRLHDAGIDADGRIGHPDPFVAVTRLLADEEFDEIVLSTLPPALSRWLDVDLPKRLEHRSGLPVTTLTPSSA
ncbi:MAG TPA: hypothetical protein VMN58_12335 [Acidimicrobiales bacterium]|nr:hypothetical protein [Acidimicrobiales bacterium]